LVDEGIAYPILLGNPEVMQYRALQRRISLEGITIVDPGSSPEREEYARRLWEKRRRKGLSLGEASQRMYISNYFGSQMVESWHADALVSGVSMHYPETIRPALELIGAHPKAKLVSGMYMLIFDKQLVFCGDTTVNIDPTSDELARIAI